MKTGDADVDAILSMLTYCRCDGSEGEQQFIERFILPLDDVEDLDGMAYRVVVGEGSKTVFSAHTDSVHSMKDPTRQPVDYDANLGLALTVADMPLGADDAAGCWLMLELIKAGVPGTYLFHRCEERGGVGSSGLAKAMPTWLRGFDRAVAFDRRGTGDVITHQSYGRCCSDTFAKALAGALNAQHKHFHYKPSDGGVFTDTANYTHLIAECTNLSCGYEHEHSPNETLDVEHLIWLRDALVQIDWEALPTKREPKDEWGDYSSTWSTKRGSGSSPRPGGFSVAFDYLPDIEYSTEDVLDMTLADMEDAAYESPKEFARAVYKILWGDTPV